MAPGMGGKDHYAMLEVPMSADDATIAASYRRLARLKHPDKNRTNPNATAEFQALQEAYTVLKDNTKRFEYDRRILLKKGPAGGGAPRARATAARTAATSASASATMAATAAAVDMLRQKRKQSQQEQSAAASAGIFAFHVHTSWDGKTPVKPKAQETKQDPTTPQPMPTPGQATTTPRSDKANKGEPIKDYSSHGASVLYPPRPSNLPQWPNKPPSKDHALEKQIRQVRKEIRAEEKTIRRLNRGSKKTAAEIATLWETVRGLDDELARVAATRAKMEEKLVEQEWHDGLFGEQPAIRAVFPMPRPVSPKTAERIKQGERTYKSLQKKLAKAYEAIETAMAGSRSVVDEVEEAHARKATKEAALHDLGRRWRIHEFGVDSAETEGGGFTEDWDGWCGWDEGEVDLDTDDKNDGIEEDDDDVTSTAYTSSRTWDQSNGSASWWHSSDETVYADHGASFAFNPIVDEWVPDGSNSSVPVAESESRSYYGVRDAHSNAHGLEDIFFDTQAGAAQHGHTGVGTGHVQSSFSGYYAPSDDSYHQQAFPQYSPYAQCGRYSTPHHAQPGGGDTAYREPSNGEDSNGGGVALNGGSPGKGKQEQQQQQQIDEQEDSVLSEFKEFKRDKGEDICKADTKEPEMAKKKSVSTGRKADSLQTTTTSPTSGHDDEDDSEEDGEEDEEDENDEEQGQASGWPDEFGADLLDFGPIAPLESSDLLDLATGMAAVIPPTTATSLLPPVPAASIPYGRGIASNISTLAGSAAATQAWWPGEDYAAEQTGGNARELAWRHAQWHEW
ncbi:hypothetical protein SBRCBS47491_000762 [Sporothrix bragantina]|uniref:J domain-containing protein n=1 Tax=Sporothrix bragantina TaxID=671064 RepID=A0ABP0AT17_9PEZI